jgi:hypothetical protein|tara:strand:+ start:33 stop:620 length:588 start_codon:yes stop_codon:yes gene_type:complete
MGIKIKNRDPRSTDLRADDIIINNKEGSIFYKGNGRLYKLKGDDVKTPATESNSYPNLKVSTITATSASFLYITASVIDVDAETIRFGGVPFGKSDVQSLNAGLFPTTTVVARTSQGDDDRDYDQYIKPQAIFSPVDDSTYAKYTTAGRVGQFVGGALFFDQNRNGDNNYIALGAANTQIRITGTLTASIHGGSF